LVVCCSALDLLPVPLLRSSVCVITFFRLFLFLVLVKVSSCGTFVTHGVVNLSRSLLGGCGLLRWSVVLGCNDLSCCAGSCFPVVRWRSVLSRCVVPVCVVPLCCVGLRCAAELRWVVMHCCAALVCKALLCCVELCCFVGTCSVISSWLQVFLVVGWSLRKAW
jgi:hypothetical protein